MNSKAPTRDDLDSPDDLDELVRRAHEGDGVAFGRLFDRFHVPVLRYLVARVADRTAAEDMAAEVFVEVAQRLPRFRGDGGQFGRWLFTIARHDIVDVRRAARRHTVLPVAQVPDQVAGTDVSDEVVRRLEGQRLARALRNLTNDQRDVVVLKFAAGLSNPEVAAVLDKPVGAVKSLQHRGLMALRRALEGEEVDSP
ncbi:MAG: RNA polymerase sigma factor [Jiangellaceae bacterium]